MALPGTAGGAQEESDDAGGADQGAAARRDGGVTPETALVALRTGVDGFLAFPPQAGAETRCTTGPTSRRLLHPGPCGFGPAVPGGAGPRRRSAGAVVAPGPGPWTPSAASEALRSCCALQVVFPSMLPRREQCSCALTPGVVPGRRGGPGSLAGKPLASFRATPSRRITVLYGMVVYAIRFNNQLLHRQPTLRKRRLGENRGFRPSF